MQAPSFGGKSPFLSQFRFLITVSAPPGPNHSPRGFPGRFLGDLEQIPKGLGGKPRAPGIVQKGIWGQICDPDARGGVGWILKAAGMLRGRDLGDLQGCRRALNDKIQQGRPQFPKPCSLFKDLGSVLRDQTPKPPKQHKGIPKIPQKPPCGPLFPFVWGPRSLTRRM